MKNVITSFAALLLVIWYSLSVIGFDVHTCSSSGRTYIATVIGGTDCEDIHPEHHHKQCSCCRHHEQETESHDDHKAESKKSCCKDEWQMIELTGLRMSDEHGGMDVYVCDAGLSAIIPQICDDNVRNMVRPRTFYKPGSGGLPLRDVQAVYNIWRI